MTMPFNPAKGANQKLTATTTHAEVAIGKGSNALRVLNVGANVIFIRTYNSTGSHTETATAADTPVGPSGAQGCLATIRKSVDDDSISYLAETGNTIFHVIPVQLID